MIFKRREPAPPSSPDKQVHAPAGEKRRDDDDFSVKGLARPDQMQVSESGGGISPVCEEAAVLYSNGHRDAAFAVLEDALDQPGGREDFFLWRMLLDMFELTGERERHEARVVEFATAFNRSPPPWMGGGEDEEQGGGKKNAAPQFNLPSSVNGSAKQLTQIETIALKMGAVRVNLGRVRSCDEEGCRMLTAMLARLAAERVVVALSNVEHLISILEKQLQPGERTAQEIWKLLLELLQYTEDQEYFENMAVDYAVIFEESPPSWLQRKPQLPQLDTAEEDHDDDVVKGFSLEGEITVENNECILELVEEIQEQGCVEIDCRQLLRVDFVSAGILFNEFCNLQGRGVQVRLTNLYSPVSTLLRLIGVDQIAELGLQPR